MNILSALAKRALFGDTFTGDSWSAWRAVLAGAFALPMDAARLELFKSLAGGRKPPTGRVRELWVIAGRRSAKTHTAAATAVYLATVGAEVEGLRKRLSPGERGVVALLAVDRAQAKVALQYITGMLEASPVLSLMVVKAQAESIELNNGVSIEVSTNSYKAIRGRSLIACIFDETAFWTSDSASASPAPEVYRAALPALSTTGGMLLSISSPYSRSGLMFDKWRKHYGRDDDRVLVVQGPTTTFNPNLDPQIVADAIEEDPQAARAEWLGEFRDDVSSFITREQVEALVRSKPLHCPPLSGVHYFGFVDMSGGGADEHALGIAHRQGESVVVDGVWTATGDPATATRDFCAVLRAYGLRRVVGDRYGAEWVRGEFARHGVRLEHSELSRSQIYQEALPLLTTGRIELCPDDRLVAQIAGLERRVGRSGKDTIDHAPGAHDDRANAVLGAAALTGTGKRGISSPIHFEFAI